MGAWSEENFGNDDAEDWMHELEKSKGTGVLLTPIKAILTNSGYLESPDCSEALTASEVIAASLTGDMTLIPEEAIAWLDKRPRIWGKKPQIKKEHTAIAIQSVQKIVDDSELKELWEETEGFPKWKAIQDKLIVKFSNV